MQNVICFHLITEPNAYLSNWYPSPFEVGGTHWTWGFSPESIRWLELAAQRLGELTEQPQPE